MARPRRPLTEEQRSALDEAWEAQLAMSLARERRDAAAARAAQLGAAWREVGAAVEMSPQAAHERYAGGLAKR